MMRVMHARLIFLAAAVTASACASGPAVSGPAAQPMTYEQKMAWILRLEDDRVLALPAPEAPPPVAGPGGRGAPTAAPQPTLLTLLADAEPRIRRRAALAAGRTRVADAIPALQPVLASDPDPEVRQMAAFAMGLIGDAAAGDALIAALADPDPLVQGRAAEALGLIEHKPGAAPIAAMMAPHIASGVLSGMAADDLGHPHPPAVEAVRLGIYALVRLGAYDQLAATLLDPSGQPISRWWPVAYAFRRIDDPRAGTALLALLKGDGTITRGFAARGLGVVKEPRAVAPLVAIVTAPTEPPSVRIEAIRALADLGAREAVEPLMAIVATGSAEPNLRLEAITALGQIGDRSAAELLIDVMTDRWPAIRAAALTALARVDRDLFMTALSGLPADPHWSVRAALAAALGTLEAERAQARLTLMLDDEDQRVIAAVIRALAAVNAPNAEALIVERLGADDPVVRMAAANALAALKAKGAAPALGASYERAEKDPTYVARAAILAALTALDPAAARPLLERALEDRDWAVRVRAAELLTTLDPSSDAAARIRPAPQVPVADLNDVDALISPSVSPVAYIETDKGVIQVELAVLDAPRTVANFIALARRNFLGATPFHRIVPNFVAQDGDPRGDGEGGPGYTIRDEINQRPYLRGTVGMALDWEDTGGSQFFITHSPQPHLDARYTVFGRVIEGMDVVDRLQQWDQIRSVRIWDGTSWIGQ